MKSLAKIILYSCLFFSTIQVSYAYAKCTGKKDCKACRNCTSCKHCSQKGNSCSVCAKLVSK
ncbi:MAG TPA: hypothetical protein DCL43_07885 [Chitinophagaceae bacterium]|nr:hypothetical protein [Chitinophagaceae bacterium]HAN38064.1 hypothetical protein [Chitinophagaceae bacterium]